MLIHNPLQAREIYDRLNTQNMQNAHFTGDKNENSQRAAMRNLKLRMDYSNGMTRKELAKKYNLSASMVNNIIRNAK